MKKEKVFKLVTGITILAIVVALASYFVIGQNHKLKAVSAEMQRTMTYDEVQDEEEKVQVNGENFEYVTFDAFFLRDLNEDGTAEGVRGTCKEVGKEDTLYMELKVLTNGYLENGKITINSDNFYFDTAIVADAQVKQNYIGSNIKEIEFKQINNGTQKLLTGTVRSGDYGSNQKKIDAIGNDITKYSKINSVTLTGTHVDSEGTRTEIEKTVEFNVDWYGTVVADISASIAGSSNLIQTRDITQAINEDTQEINLGFEIGIQETKSELILKKSYIEGIIPELNGYAPTKVQIAGSNINYTYDEETGKFTIQKEATTDQNGIIKTQAYVGIYGTQRYNKYKLNVTYPLEAYKTMGQDTVEIKIPVTGYYEGYNNTNSEFENPYKSNIANAIIVAKYEKPKGEEAIFEISVGKFVQNPYNSNIVSKKKPLRIYNGVSAEETEDTYLVTWDGYTGDVIGEKGLTYKDASKGENLNNDQFITATSTEINMENISSTIGIYFSDPSYMLGGDGEIRVYDDETGVLLEKFTKDNWNQYNAATPYKFETPQKHIRVETSNVNDRTSLTLYLIKELNDKYITENFEKEEFDNLKYIKSTLVGYLGVDYINKATNTAKYEVPVSIATVDVSEKQISTQETQKNLKIEIKTQAIENNNQTKWVNGAFLIKLPKDTLEIEINEVLINNSEVKIVSYEQYEENGEKFIKINTENEKEANYTITVDCDLTPDPRIATTSEEVKLYAYNQNNPNYYTSELDTYDVNDNLNTEEQVNISTISMVFISPNSLLTNQIATNYNEEGSQTIAPQVAIISKGQRQATVNVEISNNYNNTISEVKILGKIPFEGNDYVINRNDMGSNFSVTMNNTGIILPEELKQIAKVYYSTNENPTNDLQDEQNGWSEEVTDFSTIKSYMIDLGTKVLEKGETHKFSYDISIPEGINYGQVTYSHHAVYFSLDTEEGKYRTQTEPNKLGFMVSKLYDLELTKYQAGKSKKIQGATYLITEDGAEEGKTKTTNKDGKAIFSDLYVDKTYIIKEIKSPEDYELNEEEIKFTANEINGEVKVTVLEGSVKNLLEIQKTQEHGYQINIEVEDEAKAQLKLTKLEKGTSITIPNVVYNIKGKGIQESGKFVFTNSNGQIDIKGLYINEEYTIQETSVKGYYLEGQPIKFKIVNNQGNYEVQITNGTVKSSLITTENEIPTLNLEVENQKIPQYKLKIVKMARGTEKTLQNAYFKIAGEDKQVIIRTDENGEIILNDLYAYEANNAGITGEYKIEELIAPEGYIKNSGTITLKVNKTDSGFEVDILEGSVKAAQVENDIISIQIENDPVFEIVKKDGQTGELLPGVKFAINKVEINESGENILSEAKTISGEIVGEVTNIEGEEYRVITTDENGSISLELEAGTYRIVEVETLEKYRLEENVEDRTYYFEIGEDTGNLGYGEIKNIASITTSSSGWYTNVNQIVELEDGYAVVTRYNAGDIIEASKTSENKAIKIENAGLYLTKYNQKDQITKMLYLGNISTLGIGYVNDRILMIGQGNKTFTVQDTTDGSEKTLTSAGTYQIFITEDLKVEKIMDCGFASYYYTNLTQKIPWTVNFVDIQETDDGGYIKTGLISTGGKYIYKIEESVTESQEEIEVIDFTEYSNPGYNIIVLLKYNANNKIEDYIVIDREKIDGGVIKFELSTLKKTPDGGYVLIGNNRYQSIKIPAENTVSGQEIVSTAVYSSSSNGYNFIIKMNSELKVEWLNGFPFDEAISVQFNNISDIEVDNEGNITVVGGFYYNNASFEIPAEKTEDNEKIVLDFTNIDTGSATTANTIIQYNSEGKIRFVTIPTVIYEDGSETAESLIGNGIFDIVKLEDGTFISIGNNSGVSKTNVEYTINPEITENNKTITIVNDNYNKKNILYHFAQDGKIINAKLLEANHSSNSDGGSCMQGFLLGDSYCYCSGNKLYKYQISLSDTKEKAYLEVENSVKSYKITTDVKELYGKKGGNISGEDETMYEEVPYGENSEKEIIMVPDENYEILSITVNGEDYSFEKNEDGTYTMPQFTNMQEDKHIVVAYTLKTNKITINKVDSNTKENIPGAKFEIKYIGDTDANSVLGEMTNNGTYYFVEEDGKYVSNNAGQTYASANSYVEIDLEDYIGEFTLTVNAEISSHSYSGGYAAVTESTKVPSYKSSTSLIYITGTQSAKDYQQVIQGGKKYYLHLQYYRGTYGAGTDTFTINSITLQRTDTIKTVETDEQGKATAQIGYGKYTITEVKAPNGYILNETPMTIDFTENGVHEYTMENESNPNILVHHYIKGTTTKLAEDEVQEGKAGDNYTTNPHTDFEKYQLEKDENGEYILPTNATGTFVSGEQIVITYYYVEKDIPLTVHHYIEGTKEPVPLNDGTLAQDVTDTGKEGETYTTTSVEDNLSPKYELVENPINAQGTYEYPEVVVTYYYKLKEVKVTTQVDGEGGTILGQGETPYETAIYGENSTKDIIATPEDGYRVSKITVNGEEIEFTPNEDGTVEVSKFVNMTEDKHVIVSFEEIKANVIVHYYIEGTTTKVPSKTGGEVEDITKTGSIGDIYTTKSSPEVADNYELVAEPENSNGLMTKEDIIVTYYYRLKEVTIESSITKEGTDKITAEEQEVTYNIKYTAKVEDYIGDATLTIVDTLPFEINEEKSSLQGGVYDKSTKTITWTETITDIDTFANGEKIVNVSKEITVVYSNIDTSKTSFENEVIGKMDLDTTKQTDTTKPAEKRTEMEFTKDITITKVWNHANNTSEVPTSVILQVKNGETLVKEQEVSETDNWTYTFTGLSKYDANGTEIDYKIDEKEANEGDLKYYKKSINNETKTITNTYMVPLSVIEKEGTEEINNKDTNVYYEINYNTTIRAFKGVAKITLTDYLPYPIDVDNSNLSGGIYSENQDGTYTITWEEIITGIDTYQVDEDKVINIGKTISVKYKYTDLQNSGAKIVNNVKAKVELKESEQAETIVEDVVETSYETKIKIPTTVIVHHYIYDKETDKYTDIKIAPDEEIQGVVGQEYETTKSSEVKSNYICKDEKPTNYEGNMAEETIEVNYYYYLVDTSLENEITKKAEKEEVVNLNETIIYDISYKTTIKDYIGKVYIEIKDKLPAKIDETKSNLDGGTYDSDEQTITWTKEVQVDTYKNGIYNNTIDKQIKVVYKDQDTTKTLENQVVGTTKIYYPEVHPTKPSQERASVTDDDVAEVKYELIPTDFVSSIEKTGTEQIIKSDEEVLYNIKYKSTIKDYIGEAVVTIQDALPYKIDETKSDLNGGIYNSEKQTIIWNETIQNINTYENGNYELNINKDIKIVFINIDTSKEKMTNDVVGTLQLTGEEENVVKDSHDTKINIKGKVITKYVDKQTGKEIIDSKLLEDKVGTEYKTIKEDIDKYIYVETRGNETGKIKEETIEVIYYYEPSAEVIVKYVDEQGNEIAPQEILQGKVGEKYTTKQKEIDDYKFVKTTGNAQGEMTKETITVTYIYTKLPAGGVIVRYLEKDTEKELASQETLQGKIGDAYQTERKVIENYQKADPEPKNQIGNMTEEIIYVTYYYEKIPSGKLKVKYVDLETKQEITNGEETYGYEIKGFVGEEYKAEQKEIPYYRYVESLKPENQEGKLTKQGDTVIFYYEKMLFNIGVEKRIEEIDINGQKVKVRNNKLMKVEIVESEIPTTQVKITYTIVVKNTGEIEGKAIVEDKIPQGYKISKADNSIWQETEEGNIITEVTLKPQEQIELEVILEWENNSSNFGEMKNIACIKNTENIVNYTDKIKEDNQDEATIVMSIKTGNETMIIATTILFVALIGSGILSYQYAKNRKR